ncbi:hypothetical protein ACFQ23_06440 [Schaalia naturae]|uniref:Secreted protein n=1 Tax=Schaalia naturae TaxID=635203 RepID=A0ABW2SM28_9ACTO
MSIALFAVIVAAALLLSWCSRSGTGADEDASPSSPASPARGAARSIDPSAAPSPSALRGSVSAGQSAPELLGSGQPKPGAGFSPGAPASARQWTVRLPDYYQGQYSDLVLSPLTSGGDAVDPWMEDELYADEAWMLVRVHVIPHGYGADDYAQRADLRLQGQSGRWYLGQTLDFAESTAERDDEYVFAIPRWDIPVDPVVEVSPSGSYGGSSPVYMDVG